ncbi:lysM and putative peptidoglycan-binding domain-containing protein 4 isoform X2 [Harpegnathos saltator]|uniref:lysM and putative peptidoglycan-binding domain-containing protein 4 isoform X2 n=1 Tax=Harpegnathos saltator TaxID=610380 RepID=UPI00058AEBBD|nr:lysM and putative peptidoglycan-binding domain-containing protein 4 isoform X2 [Harpegnathos saltator]
MMNRQGIHLRGNQKEGSPHYVYLDEEDCDENIILLNINQSSSRLHKIEVINVEVKPGDTLQALALRYSCTISELKQINKIDKENEIHAKPYIKVPVQPFSVLTEKKCDNVVSAQNSEEESVKQELNLNSTSTNIQSSENNSLASNRQRTGIMRDIFNCSGDDCGLSWRQLFICAFLVVFIIPIIYIYIYITNIFGRALKKNVTTTN